MSAVRQSGTIPSLTIAASTTDFGGPVGQTSPNTTTEALRSVVFRTAGTLSRLMTRKTAGDRTGMTSNVRVGGANGAGAIAFTSANGVYEDLTGSDAVAAGQAVAYSWSGGTGGTTSLTLRDCAFDWAATGTTTTHLGVTGLAALAASQTVFAMPGGTTASTTQANGEWLVKLPPGVPFVTLKNLYVHLGGSTPTNPVTVSINGATGAGTAPSVSATTAGASFEDTANSVQAQDGDKISFKIISGAGATQATVSSISIEVDSPQGVSFLVMGNPAGVALGLTGFETFGQGGFGTSTTESDTQITAGAWAGRKFSLLSAYSTVGGTASGVGLRANGAIAGAPAQVRATTTTANAWNTDTANSFVPAAGTDLLNFQQTGTAGATVTCIAITVSPASLVYESRRVQRNSLLRR